MENRKNVLIIGASSEIAQAVIQKLEHEIYTILTTSRQGDTTTYALDLTDEESIASFEKAIAEKPINCVLYCAGFIKPDESTKLFFSEYGTESEKINFSAAVRLCTKLSQSMQDHGVIVALSSTAGIWGNPQFPIYSSWKGALNTFFQSLNKQLKEHNKYAFSICPGPTNTKMRELIAGDAAKHQSPDSVADFLVNIIENPKKYEESPILVIREEKLYKLSQDLIQIHQ
jgi:short-subunit dehydrogenase